MKRECLLKSGKCEFHKFLDELLNILEFEYLSLMPKKRIRNPNKRLKEDIELIFVKVFVEQFYLLFY